MKRGRGNVSVEKNQSKENAQLCGARVPWRDARAFIFPPRRLWPPPDTWVNRQLERALALGFWRGDS